MANDKNSKTTGQAEQQQAPADLQRADNPPPAGNEQPQEPAQVVEQPAQEPETASPLAGLFEPNALEVVAKCESFRRAGRVFTREASTVRLAELSEAELQLLCQEPMLAVQPTYIREG
ncbi:hypothetical protein [Chromobacterium violaceum]|uniref:Mu-like prophage FluMu N-terminal domain-containing protein n=1 Tax=Chromobacterium violaceum TaxID=536 RepID=A0AAX2M8L6_CHRVL|nr:hypothetical protein [Chromobacterium violaceum]OLZ67599.1 hypothetical protein BS642_21535 [Chromobacterium violaceum]STB70912.1 Uncharacterised protein [Chromobacterium violaceum]SUX33048.1 Uncharacterised protein [Chromobacterium violaceum]